MLLVLVGGVMTVNATDYYIIANQDGWALKTNLQLLDDDNDGTYSVIIDFYKQSALNYGEFQFMICVGSELANDWSNVLWVNSNANWNLYENNSCVLSTSHENDSKLMFPVSSSNTFAIKVDFTPDNNTLLVKRLVAFCSSKNGWLSGNSYDYLEETANKSKIYVSNLSLENGTEFKIVCNEKNNGTLVWRGNENNQYLSDTGNNISISADGVYTITADCDSYSWNDPTIVTVPVTMTYPYATFSSKYALDFTNVTYVRAYQASMSGTKVLMTRVSGKVPANTGLFLARQEGGDSEEIPTTICTTELTGNLMKASTGEPVVSNNLYSLVKRGDDYGFAKVASGYTWAEGKAYLETPAEVNAPSLGFSMDDDETTTIHSINIANNPAEDGMMYNLEGKRIDQPSKGVYIVNGKKVIIK